LRGIALDVFANTRYFPCNYVAIYRCQRDVRGVRDKRDKKDKSGKREERDE
jgi:hypothetical protein